MSTSGSVEPNPFVANVPVPAKKSASEYFSLARPQTVIESGLSAPCGTMAPGAPEISSLTLTVSLFLTPAGNVVVHEEACVSSAPGVRYLIVVVAPLSASAAGSAARILSTDT